MTPFRRATVPGLLAVCVSCVLALALAACGSSKPAASGPVTLTYRAGTALHTTIKSAGTEPGLRLQDVTYSSVDGQRVPALFAIPTKQPPLACLVYQGGLGQTKEQEPQVREGAAQLRLATFTIDPRDGGARGSVAKMVAAIRTPQTLLPMLLDTVVDERVGLDFLERQPECHHQIAYMGTSFGAVVGVLVSAQDLRINATVLTSLGATFEEATLVDALAAQSDPQADLPVQVPGASTNPALLAQVIKILGPYDPVRWIGKISPRPLLLIEGRHDPLVAPVDALDLANAAGSPKTVVYFNGGHDPFAPGPGFKQVEEHLAHFLIERLNLPL